MKGPWLESATSRRRRGIVRQRPLRPVERPVDGELRGDLPATLWVDVGHPRDNLHCRNSLAADAMSAAFAPAPFVTLVIALEADPRPGSSRRCGHAANAVVAAAAVGFAAPPTQRHR